MAKSYRELLVWQRSIDLAERIYRLTSGFPSSEQYGLSLQMRRAGVSIPSNIAEGWGRSTRKDYAKFISIARGSNDELHTQLVIAQRLSFGDASLIGDALAKGEILGRMLKRLHDYLRKPLA